MMRSKQPLPNFIYIGPDKAGSTWLYNVLKMHPEVFMSPAKGLFFFDLYYKKGLDWYLKHFQEACPKHRVIGEVSHDYLFSVDACEKIAKNLPNIKLMVCLREPVERAFSAYLFMLRQGRVNGSFEQALKIKNELVDHGLYAKHLYIYIKMFGLKNIHIGIFDDLKYNPSKFLKELYEFLEIKPLNSAQIAKEKVLPASYPRCALFAKYAKLAAMKIRQIGYPVFVNQIKGKMLVNRILYKTFDDDNKPIINIETNLHLREKFFPDILKLDSILNLCLAKRWGYKEN
jgi:hypothetical protein